MGEEEVVAEVVVEVVEDFVEEVLLEVVEVVPEVVVVAADSGEEEDHRMFGCFLLGSHFKVLNQSGQCMLLVTSAY